MTRRNPGPEGQPGGTLVCRDTAGVARWVLGNVDGRPLRSPTFASVSCRAAPNHRLNATSPLSRRTDGRTPGAENGAGAATGHHGADDSPSTDPHKEKETGGAQRRRATTTKRNRVRAPARRSRIRATAGKPMASPTPGPAAPTCAGTGGRRSCRVGQPLLLRSRERRSCVLCFGRRHTSAYPLRRPPLRAHEAGMAVCGSRRSDGLAPPGRQTWRALAMRLLAGNGLRSADRPGWRCACEMAGRRMCRCGWCPV